MSEEQLKELQEYNLEYLEAHQSEEIFGGDYTSAVELKYAKKEIERLKEELKEQNEIIEIGRKREYHSKFLKDFQKERGKNVFPDHDEIYKRYDDYKDRVEKAIEYIEKWQSFQHTNGSTHEELRNLKSILKGSDK